MLHQSTQEDDPPSSTPIVAVKQAISAAGIKIGAKPGIPDATHAAAPSNDDAVGIVVPAPQKGGEGGEDTAPASPPFPPSNGAFVEMIFGTSEAGVWPLVCSKPADPAEGGWQAQAADNVNEQCPSYRNNYINCSTFRPGQDGVALAQKDLFHGYHFLLLDDVGTKVDPARLEGFQPTWAIETSPGNRQLGIVLTDPLLDAAGVKRLQDAVIAAQLCDPGANGVGRWARLPYAINGKEKHRTDDDRPFACRFVAWNPQVRYSVDEIADLLGLELDPVRAAPVSVGAGQLMRSTPARGDGVYTPKPPVNPALAALKSAGLYKREIAAGKHEVRCPWVEEHSDALDSGAAYFEPDEDFPLGGFCCQHSHRDDYHIIELLEHLNVDPNMARGKARIRVTQGELNRVKRAAEDVLAEKGDVFQSGGLVVSVRRAPGSGNIAMEMLSEQAIAAALADAADWEVYDGRSKEWSRRDPPVRTVQQVYKSGSYDRLPVLGGLVRQPYFLDDGVTLIASAGYHQGSQLFADFDPGQFPLPEPTEANVRAALAKLSGLIEEFHFATPQDRSTALCAMITAAVRQSLPVAPAFNITASAPGSGKSYLGGIIASFAGPGQPMTMGYPATAEEASKAMLAALLQAPAAVMFDDMQFDWLPHSVMNRIITSSTISERILGVSRNATVSTRAFLLGTGNNIGPVRDMCRRVATIRLAPKSSSPATLRYNGNPLDAVRKSRGEYVAAALTVARYWMASGQAKLDVPSIASFDGLWASLCRYPLIALGEIDPAASLIAQVQEDPDGEALGRLMTAWRDRFGSKAVMVRKIIAESEIVDDLEDALFDLPVVERGSINPSKLGWYLKRHANRIVDGFEIQKAPCKERQAWAVVPVDTVT
ncbi:MULTISPECIES: DNA-primase RepB domain-containing protein [Sphingobium]|jgi:hypothetical protein|uniref:DNA-primase RepB domain-containing protein n=1 Tax=Sphingobium TaxID=165695 RepID=UPI000E72889E|nr:MULTISPECIES: DNA-primase RepB domain-containing protein [Sphingobium]KAA9016060.1 hypothetical protein F4U94_10380 [Sphingobium limneticum]